MGKGNRNRTVRTAKANTKKTKQELVDEWKEAIQTILNSQKIKLNEPPYRLALYVDTKQFFNYDNPNLAEPIVNAIVKDVSSRFETVEKVIKAIDVETVEKDPDLIYNIAPKLEAKDRAKEVFIKKNVIDALANINNDYYRLVVQVRDADE